MKRLKKFIKSNIKTVVAFIIGLVLAGGSAAVVYAVTATQITYTDTNNIGATTVQDAIDKLGERANTWIDPSTIQTNSTGKIFASSKGIIIRRNGQTHLIRISNFDVEKDHIQQIFSDVGAYNSSTDLGCNVSSNFVGCYASDFRVRIRRSDGYVDCDENSDTSYCYVNGGGSVSCR